MGVYENDNGNLKLISGATLYADAPIGSIVAYGGATAPNGWLLCQGQAISRTDYAELFAAIGTAYGSGDGSTTFNVPDGREATIKGAGLTGLSNNHMDADGLQVGEFIDDRLQFHSHNTYLNGIQVSAGGLWATVHDYAETGTHTSNPESPARTGNTTEVKAVGANWIIKAQQVALPADLEAGVKEVVAEGEKYSTTEVKTNKTWIDGKPIYRQVQKLKSGVSVGDHWVPTWGLSFVDVDTVTYAVYIQGHKCAPAVIEGTGAQDYVKVLGPSGNTDNNSYMIVEYTKTTD